MRNFTREDFKQVKEWFEKRGYFIRSHSELPRVGIIADGLAAGFIVQTDTPTAMFDFFVTNPEAPALSRARALHAITQKLLFRAKAMGFSRVYSSTRFGSIGKLALRHGFRGEWKRLELFREI